MKTIEEFTSQQLKKDLPIFNVGDTLRVHVRTQELDKIRVHPFEGTVIAKKGRGISETFTLRKISFGEGVEKIFQLHSPNLEKIEVLQKGKVRRAKLYYLRKKTGKGAKVSTEEQ
ncbi:MAG: 50S ribosomal protein L19 [Candidatus Omnitrophota bacterium]